MGQSKLYKGKSNDELLEIIQELQDELDQSKAKLKSLPNFADQLKRVARYPDENPEPIMRVDRNGDVAYNNKAGVEILKELRKEENLSIRQFINQAIEEAFVKGERVSMDIEFDEHIYKLYIIPFIDTNDANLYFYDISKRKSIEREFDDQKNFYEGTLDTIPTPMAVFGVDYKYVYVNPAAIEDDELREWMIGKDDFDFCKRLGIDIEIAEVRKKHYAKAANDRREVEWEELFVQEDGSKQYYLRKISPMLNEQGELQYIVGYGVDITELKLAQERLVESEKHNTDLINYTQAVICTHNLDGVLTSANPALESILEYPEEEIVGNELSYFIPDEFKRYYRLYLHRINNHAIANGVMTVQSKSGNIIHLMYRNYKVQEEGKEAYVIGFAQDITERLEAEQQLKEAKQVAEAALKVRELFLANISHEIRTPMNGIIGLVDLLSNTPLDATQHKYIDVIKKSASNLLVLLNDVLDIAKIDSGKLEFENIPFKIKETLSSSVQSIMFNANERGNTLHEELNIDSELMLQGDPYRLNQVVLNLLNNANKFTESGDVTLKTEVIEETDDKVKLQFSVTDTGIGISKEKQESIFGEFTQANAETTRKYGGTGLGLTICKRLINMLDGKIWLESEEGKGTTFYFEVEYHKASIEQKQEKEKEEPVKKEKSLKGVEVLVAEDNEINRFLARTVLENWGATVITVNNGLEAVNAVKEKPYSIILMDIQMPEMNGLDASKAIRDIEDQSRASIPIIALTANALKGEEDKCKQAGMDEYLSKPFDQNQLYTYIVRLTKVNPVILEDNSTYNIPMFDLTRLDKHVQGNPDFKKRMVNLFITNAENDLGTIETAVNDANWDVLKRIAHKLKPSLDIIGAEEVRKLALDVETFVPDSSNQELGFNKVEKFKTNLMSLISQLKEHQKM